MEPFYSSYDGYEISKASQTLNFNSWYDRLFYDLGKTGILMRRAKLMPENNQVIIELSNYRYQLTADAIKRALTLSQIHVPENITKFDLVINEDGYRVITVSYHRDNYINSVKRIESDNKIKLLDGRKIKDPTDTTTILVPRVKFDGNLATRFQLFDPDKPMKYQVYLKTGMMITLPRNWNLFGSFAFDINNNFDLNRAPFSSLPNVRTNINRYLVEGATGIDSLFLEKRATLKRGVHYRVYAGILESMYGGIGGEILYQPFGSRMAFGGSFNMLKKREFEKDFKFRDYEVMTGFISLYYATPFYNYDIALHMGKYLARDRGATLEVRRTFDNGFSIGAFATLTNVSAAKFGEGSFDKGLYFKIPFNIFTPSNTKNSLSTIIRSVQRDGGQRMEDFSGRLWHDLRGVRYDSLSKNKKRMLPK